MKYYNFSYKTGGTELKHKMLLSTWENIQKEFWGLREYLKTMVHGRFLITDHYLTEEAE